MMARSALQSAGSCVMGRGFSPIPISMVNAGRRKHCRNQSLKPALAEASGYPVEPEPDASDIAAASAADPAGADSAGPG